MQAAGGTSTGAVHRFAASGFLMTCDHWACNVTELQVQHGSCINTVCMLQQQLYISQHMFD